MFNRTKYLVTIIVLAAVSVGVSVTNAIFAYVDWIWIVLIILTGWTILRTRVLAPLQVFGTKFTMLVDYDLEIAEACRLAKEGADNAPTEKVKAIYQMYYGMGLYYAGDYETAIRTFNLIDLRRLEAVYHVLIVAFICYSAFEEGNLEAFRDALERLRGIRSAIGPKYQNFAANYIEILEAIAGLENDPEHYREIMDKHFSRDDGYISTRLIHHYRLALYDRQVGNLADMDRNLAFVIANGKSHHTVKQAEKLFTGSVNVSDFVLPDVAETVPAEEQETPQIGADAPAEEHPKEEEEHKPEGK